MKMKTGPDIVTLIIVVVVVVVVVVVIIGLDSFMSRLTDFPICSILYQL